VVEAIEPRGGHLARRGDGPVAVVLLLERGAEHGHDPVAHVVDDRPAVVEDRLAHLGQVPVENVDHPLGGHRLGRGGEAAQVAKSTVLLPPHAAQPQVLVLRPGHARTLATVAAFTRRASCVRTTT